MNIIMIIIGILIILGGCGLGAYLDIKRNLQNVSTYYMIGNISGILGMGMIAIGIIGIMN